MCQLLGMKCKYADGYCLSFEASVVVLVLPTAIQMASVSLFWRSWCAYFFAITTQRLNPYCRLWQNNGCIKSSMWLLTFVKLNVRRCDHWKHPSALFVKFGDKTGVFAHNGNLKEDYGYVWQSFCSRLAVPTDSEAAFCYMASEYLNRFRRKTVWNGNFWKPFKEDITKELLAKGTF